MKLVVLTTDTVHHTFFVQNLSRRYDIAAIFVETVSPAAPFPVEHPFEKEREEYEREHWFKGKFPELSDFACVSQCSSMNDSSATAELAKLSPDVVVVFGTGLLKQDVISCCPEGMINFHGGNPERYRGLDSHLWAIYHRDFAGLVTTLHRVNSVLDDGQVIVQSALPIRRKMELYELRAVNTEECIQLVTKAMAMREESGSFLSRSQRQNGRYYSFMPTALKDICVGRFFRYTRGLS